MTKFKIITLITLILLLAITYQCSAVVPFFHALDNQDVLITKNIRTIAQDKSGYIWIGTSSGLYQYDGYEFSEIPLTKEESDLVVNTVYVDSQGIVWVGTNSYGLYKLTKNKFKPFKIKLHDSSNTLSIFDITQDKVGNYWLATDHGLKYISVNDDLSEEIADEFGQFKSIGVNALELLDDNKLLIGTKGSFNLLDTKNNSYRTHKFQGTDISVHDFLIDSNNNLWNGTSKGLLKFSLKLNDFIESPIQSLILRITKLIEYNGQLWVATIRGGLFNICLLYTSDAADE